MVNIRSLVLVATDLNCSVYIHLYSLLTKYNVVNWKKLDATESTLSSWELTASPAITVFITAARPAISSLERSATFCMMGLLGLVMQQETANRKSAATEPVADL